jgi:cytochrome c556
MLRTFVSAFIFIAMCSVLSGVTLAMAADDPAEQRHELMEDVGDAAKPLGEMLKGEREFDAGMAMQSFGVMQDAAGVVGDLFPEGSYVGGEKKARETVWSDREGFTQKLADFSDAVTAAMTADPQSRRRSACRHAVFKPAKPATRPPHTRRMSRAGLA